MAARMPNQLSRSESAPCGSCDSRPSSPHVIIDGQGYEVGVVVEYAHYISLLGILATQLDSAAIPPYWRGAVDHCLSMDRANPVAVKRRATDGRVL